MKRASVSLVLNSLLLLAVTAFSHTPALSASVTLPATNRAPCYHEAGTAIDCTGTGQDGALGMGAT